MEDPRLEEFEKACEPVVRFLKKYGNPHSKVLITDINAVLLSGEIGVPYPEKDD